MRRRIVVEILVEVAESMSNYDAASRLFQLLCLVNNASWSVVGYNVPASPSEKKEESDGKA